VSDQDHPEWPTADDDLPPARPAPPEDKTQPTRQRLPSFPEEATKRIQLPAVFPMVDPDTADEPLTVIGLPPVADGEPPTVIGLSPVTGPEPPRASVQPTTPLQKPKPLYPQGYPPPEPPRAAPMRIEPQQPLKPPPPAPVDGDETEPEPRRSRRSLFIVGAVVLVILVAAGVVFAVPGLRAKIGFGPDEPVVAIKPAPAPVAFTPTLHAPSADAPTPSAEGVKGALAGPASASALGTLNGTVLDPATGNVLWDQRATTAITPASTAKILTSAAALLKLDRGQQFVTRVVAGKDPGSVILVGGGDPTVSSLPVGKNSVYPGAAHLDDLVAQVKASAGGKVSQVFFDVGRYTGDGLAQGWIPGDVPGGFIAPIVPMMLDGGRQDPTKVDNPRTGTPAKAFAAELAKRLGAAVAAKPEATAPADAKVLGEIRSAPLAELIDNYLQISDNVLAETVAREVAKSVGEEASFAGVSRTTLKTLQDNGFDTAGAQLIDGSGLSTSDHVPPRLLASVLAVAAGPDGKDPRTVKLRSLLGGLPVAGGSGTLEPRFGPGTPAASGRGWVRAKTGTLSGVNALAGVVLDADGRLLVFTMMTSGTDANAARPALDAVAAALRGCGCK
jgi:serine-type D-Ala-D-Ala carboxypeptidase/endopeptidase (penicillin-binding protein 4)